MDRCCAKRYGECHVAIATKQSIDTHARELQLRDYWPIYRRQAIIMTVCMQLAVVLIIATSLIISGTEPADTAFWITVMAATVVTMVLNLVLVTQLLTPLRDLTNTVVSAAGEKPRYALANPNMPHYVKNGFKKVLQFVYDNVAQQSQPSSDRASIQSSTENSILDTALNASKAGVIIMSGEGKLMYTNQSAPVKNTPEHGQQLELLFDPETDFVDWLKNCRDTAVHAEKTWLRVPNRIVGDQDRRIFNITASYEKGSVSEVVLVAFDATDTYQPEDDELDFIAFAAHELRGPITVIRGYLDVLDIELGEQMQPDQKALMKRLIVSANRLTGYVNNILNTSKYDRRHLKLHLVEDTVTAIYDSIRDDIELRASSQNRLLGVTIPSNLPSIAADRSSIGEVMANLIDNAIKYSNEGGAITVSVSASQDFVKISVQDQGIGMPSNVVSNLFHKFYRSHRSRETVAGTGIGLYICKAIVESHGGTIEVTSVEGQGSVFSFTIPTYASVADKLIANDHTNTGLISSHEGWIQNHARFKG